MTVVSFGGGVQSSALTVLSVLGLKGCPKADVVVFADTQDEPRWVYAQVEAMRGWCEAQGTPLVVVTAGRLSAETYGLRGGQKPRAALPVYTEGADGREAMLPRQCTEEYKPAPIRAYLRARLGYRPRQRIPEGAATALIGISFEERDRIKESRHPWIVNRWPLVEAVMRRVDCADVLKAHGLTVPRKSACYYCPFHDDRFWAMLRAEEPATFEEACRFDEAVRTRSRAGASRPVYLHRSLLPLRDVSFSDRQSSLLDGFAGECGGSCGT